MRKIILGLGLIISSFCSAQTTEMGQRIITGSLLSELAGGLNIGANVEWSSKKANMSMIAYAARTIMGIDINDYTEHYDGTGFTVGYGLKSYWGENKNQGWFSQNSVDYVRYNYTDILYSGTYQYISLVNPQVGYKLRLGNFAIEPSIGFSWKIEIKGQGDIDNKSFSNTHGKFGLSAGYMF